MEAIQVSPGGLARNPDGTLAHLPHAIAHSLSAELMNVIALLRAAAGTRADFTEEVPDSLHTRESRADSLSLMAEDKVRTVIERLSPYI